MTQTATKTREAPNRRTASLPVRSKYDAAIGGFGSAVLEVASSLNLGAENVRLLGLPDHFIAHASRREQLAQAGLDADHLASTLKEMIDNPPRG